MEIKYPNVTVKLTDTNGNAFAVMGKVKKALKENGVPQSEIDQFLKEATSGDYDNLLQTVMKWVEVE